MKILLPALLVFGAIFFFVSKPQQTTTPAATQAVALAVVPKETEAKNLDASKKLIMSEEKTDEGATYTFFVTDENGKNRKLLFTAIGEAMSIPRNSWAPNDTYVFIKRSEPSVTFLVFNASGELFGTGEKYLDIAALFAGKQPELVFADATGWDGAGLVHVTSTTKAGTKGPSFWFDVASKSFLQLSR